MVPANAERKPAVVGKMHAAQLLCGLAMLFGMCCTVAGFFVKDVAIICDGVRGCMWEKSAPFPGPFQAFADNPSEPRIVKGRQTDVYLVVRVNWRCVETLNMAVFGVVGVVRR